MTADKPLFRIEGDKIYCAHPRILQLTNSVGVEYYCHNLQMCHKRFDADEVVTNDDDGSWELKS